jgi:CheY-like chemotaxis protein
MKHIDKILIVDDDETSTFLVKILLENMKIASQIVTATNGKEALDYIDAHCLRVNNSDAETSEKPLKATFCPELIFLDINMPIMNGFEFLEECRQKQCFKEHQVKVVMLTSSASGKDLEQAKAFQVAEYIVKPLTKEKVLKLIG